MFEVRSDPAGRLDAPQHVDLEAVHLPDLHGDDGVLDVEGQLPLDLFLELGNRLPRGHDLPDHGIGDFPVRKHGHQPGQGRILPHLDVQLVPGSDPVVRFGGRLERGYPLRVSVRLLLRRPKRERYQRQQEHRDEQPLLHSHPSLPLPRAVKLGSVDSAMRVNRCSGCLRSPGAPGCMHRAPGFDEIHLYFQLFSRIRRRRRDRIPTTIRQIGGRIPCFWRPR